ncbi:MAG: hypothetical protein AAFW73_24760 [Bacteroidota bacterium]
MKTVFNSFFGGLVALLFILSFAACTADNELASSGDTGVGGSLARFTIIGDYLYAIDHTNLKVFDLENPAALRLVGEQEVGQIVETIFPLNDLLFIGSAQSSYIYRVTDNGIPEYVSEYDHSLIVSCDPIVATEKYAYVTLRSGGDCRVGFTLNELHILDVEDINNPRLIATYPMQHPLGLGIDGDLLFLCDDAAGLKVFNVADPASIELLYHFTDMVAYDVITLDGQLIVVGPDDLYQFDYRDRNNIRILSQIPIKA